MCDLAISYTGSQIRSNKSFYHFIIIAMKKTVAIKWIQFTKKNLDPVYNWKNSIFDLYDHPSHEKIDIFNYWDWVLDEVYWLTGSKFSFSIYWLIKDEDGITHDVKITKSYNYILN